MGYLFLSLALATALTKGFFGKKLSGYTADGRSAVLITTVRMALCVVIGFAAVLVGGSLTDAAPTAQLIAISALSGIASGITTALWLYNVRQSAYMMADVFNLVGMLIPIFGGLFMFGEPVKLTQWIGMALLFIATALMCSYNNTIKVKMTVSGFLLLAASAAASGVNDFSQKLFVRTLPDVSAAVFNLYTYLFAFVELLIVSIIICRRTARSSADKPREKMPRFTFVFIVIMALCLFLNSYFKTLAAAYLDAALLYPLNIGGSLILSMIMSAIAFREKITPKSVAGITISFVGLIFINVL